MHLIYQIFICLSLVKLSHQQICPFDFNLGYSSRNCLGTSSENVILGGELFYFKYQDQFSNLMVSYGSSGLFGIWNLTDASLLYSTTYYQDQNIEFHSIFVDQQANLSDPTISQTFVYVVDQRLNVYQQSLYQDQGKLILKGSSIANNLPISIKLCYNIRNNILFYPQNNYVYQRKNNQDFQVEIDSEGIQCENSNFNSVLLFSTPNQINDYGFLKNNTLIACGANSLIQFGNYSVNPQTQGIDTTDYDYKNIQPDFDISQLNYTNLVIGDDYSVFYGSQSVITVVINTNLVVKLHKYLGTSLLVGLIPKAIIEGSLLKTLSSSGLLFLEMSNGQLKKNTSCFRALSVYEEKIVGLYFDDELLRVYALENQGKLGYFGYPKGEYLTQYYNLSQNSAWNYNKKADQIYIWGIGGRSNFVVVTSYLNGTYLGQLQFNDNFTVNNVYYDNNLEIIIVVDPTQSIQAFNQKNFLKIYEQSIKNRNIQIFQSYLGEIIIYQSAIQLLTKGQANKYLLINNLNQQEFIFEQTYFDSISNSLIMAKTDQSIQLLNIDSQLNAISQNLSILMENNQIISNICYGNQYLIILMNLPNQVVVINKQTNKQSIINNLTIIPSQCLLLLNEELLLVISNISELLFMNVSSLNILKNDVLDELSSVCQIEIDLQENLLIILLSSSHIISYDYIQLKQVCDWTPVNAITVSTFQINTNYKMIVYGSGILIYFTDYSQKKLINEIILSEAAQGGVIDLQTNSHFVYTNKIYQFDLETNNLIKVSKFEHDDIITQLEIIYEWNIIITSSFDNTMAVWSYPELQFMQRLYHDPVDCVKVNNFQVELERNRVFSGCRYGSVYIWKKNALNNTFYLGNDLQYILTNWNVTSIVVDNQNDYLFLIGWYWYPLIIQLSTVEQSINVIAMLQGINAVYDKLNQCLILSDQDGNVWNYNITSRTYIFNKQNAIHQGWVNQLVIDPANQMFASMGDDCTIQIWPYDSDASQIPLFFFRNTAKIQSGKLDLILSFSNDKTVKFWEYELGIEEKYFQIIQRATSVMSYAYDEIENTIYYVRSEGNVQKWSITSEQTENGFNLQYNDRYNNTIFLINNDVFILATTKQLKLVMKKNLEVLQSIQVECSHSIKWNQIYN
ncbi:WD domain, G-beta repeat protein (macronuclear) [Tetrahymena thermophila SB210]|uniref:WD domain, G-beta repeat protein n=1 Tax=Tetrahymena thermophila (strain SB210) TaxID=312017 RepID=W7XF04_TETTS|nr:WD domain, G-beta repeat protein [Tetrahymena thermophila SB210]EWS75348.1 WD domain, G-beta repeat protein [Tetrahymena thermophila SB210]|eukprot:XP_012652108.1 WD domain, G-beta repeat protein [Tetrahymena thermophila SB210]